MLSDVQIAQNAKLEPIGAVAARCGLLEDELELYGKYKAKVSEEALRRLSKKPDGKLILVTAINPTPAGEGKTTVSVGLSQALNRIGASSALALREPSLGPVFGIKGGAAGGGYSQVVPMEDINLHFTGDMHAITAANNLLCAMLDNHIQQGNALGIDTRRIVIKRVLDMNDRALRGIVVGLGGPLHGVPREDSFMITVASEVMAILCLASDLQDLKRRLSEMIVAYTRDGSPVRCRDLKAEGAMTALLKEAIKPNLVQTLENTPCVMHGGPFANIAHGCNSVRATKLALKLGDYCVTEAGFGADLGAEKFLDIKCRAADLSPDCVVVVATCRALKYNGGVPKPELAKENVEALRAGLCNLRAHLENMKKFGLPAVCAINRFYADTEAEISEIKACCAEMGVPCEVADIFAKGGAGGEELARAVVRTIAECEPCYAPVYSLELPLREKIETVAKTIYGAAGVAYSKKAEKALLELTELGFGGLPVCMAKTQYSLSDDPTALGRPEGFTLHVSEMRVSAGAGFVVVLTGDIMTMPGLPRVPAAEGIDVDADGKITGLF